MLVLYTQSARYEVEKVITYQEAMTSWEMTVFLADSFLCVLAMRSAGSDWDVCSIFILNVNLYISFTYERRNAKDFLRDINLFSLFVELKKYILTLILSK